MAQPQVPILEINPVNPDEVELSFVPLSDIDDFLEDSVEDYELGFGELGAIKGRAAIKVKGSVAVKTPKVTPRAVLSIARVQAKTKQAVAARKPVVAVRAGLKVSRVAAPVVRALKKAVKVEIKKPTLNIPVIKGFRFKPTVAVKAKAVAKAAGKVAGRINKVVAAKAKAKSPTKIIKAVKLKPAVKLTVTKGKFPAVPINKKAVAKKQRSKHIAGQVAALAPKLSGKAGKKLAKVVQGRPRRGQASKPVALCIKACRAAKVRPVIIAQKKPAASAGASNHAPQLKARFKARQAAGMQPMQFRAVVTGLLGKLESQCAGNADMTARLRRIRKVSGVGNAS